MNKEELLKFLDDKGIDYIKVDHSPVFTVGEMLDVEFPYPDYVAKNLFIRDDKKRNYYLITAPEHKKVDLKEFRKAYETRALTFASEEDLMAKMQLIKGSVTPFGLLNDESKEIKFFIDRDFLDWGKIGIHPNLNDATVFLDTEDLIKILKENGTEIEVM